MQLLRTTLPCYRLLRRKAKLLNYYFLFFNAHEMRHTINVEQFKDAIYF